MADTFQGVSPALIVGALHQVVEEKEIGISDTV